MRPQREDVVPSIFATIDVNAKRGRGEARSKVQEARTCVFINRWAFARNSKSLFPHCLCLRSHYTV